MLSGPNLQSINWGCPVLEKTTSVKHWIKHKIKVYKLVLHRNKNSRESSYQFISIKIVAGSTLACLKHVVFWTEKW